MYCIVLDERKKRELDPTVAVLWEFMTELEKGGRSDAYTKERVEEITRFVESVTSWYDELRSLPTETILKLMKLGSRVQKLLTRAR